MSPLVRLRSIQGTLGAVYLFLAVVVAVKPGDMFLAVASIVVMLLGYLTGRTVPNVQVHRDHIFRIACPALVIILGIIGVELASTTHHIAACVVASFCAGNRLKAAGAGSAT